MTNQMWCLSLNSSKMTRQQQIPEMNSISFPFFATTNIVNAVLIYTISNICCVFNVSAALAISTKKIALDNFFATLKHSLRILLHTEFWVVPLIPYAGKRESQSLCSRVWQEGKIRC